MWKKKDVNKKSYFLKPKHRFLRVFAKQQQQFNISQINGFNSDKRLISQATNMKS